MVTKGGVIILKKVLAFFEALFNIALLILGAITIMATIFFAIMAVAGILAGIVIIGHFWGPLVAIVITLCVIFMILLSSALKPDYTIKKEA